MKRNGLILKGVHGIQSQYKTPNNSLEHIPTQEKPSQVYTVLIRFIAERSNNRRYVPAPCQRAPLFQSCCATNDVTPGPFRSVLQSLLPAAAGSVADLDSAARHCQDAAVDGAVLPFPPDVVPSQLLSARAAFQNPVDFAPAAAALATIRCLLTSAFSWLHCGSWTIYGSLEEKNYELTTLHSRCPQSMNAIEYERHAPSSKNTPSPPPMLQSSSPACFPLLLSF